MNESIPMTLTEPLILVFAYLLGSIPTGYIMGLLAGVDVRESGSGNVGATNVARVVGKREGMLTLIVDVAKGFIPVFLASRLGLAAEVVATAAVAAFLGHIFPVFLRFKGGKGVATALGAFLALGPLAALFLVAVFGAVFLIGRIVSLSSIVTAAFAPIVFWLVSYPGVFIATSLILAVIVILRHRANIQRLIAGTEPKFHT